MSQPRVTVTYAGNLVDASQTDGKIRFAVDGQAVLSRELRYTRNVQDKPVAIGHGITASVHAISGPSTTSARPVDGDPPAIPSPEHVSLLVKAAQANPSFAPATALPPGIHIMCHAEPPADDFVASQRETLTETDSATPPPSPGTWSALWEGLNAGTGATEDAERLAWQEPCLKLVAEAARGLGSEAISSVVRDVPAPKGWALVPCAPSSNLVCSLARGGRTAGGGKVAWLHLPQEAAEGAALALTDSLLLASGTHLEPSYASVFARMDDHDEIEVIAEAHRILPGGVLSGYDLSWTRPNARLELEERLDGRADDPEAGVSDARFVDGSAATAAADADVNAVQRWRGTVSTEELPGGGLHRHVRLKVDVSCLGDNCGRGRGERHAAHNEWCEVLLAQHVPQGAYIDVDEVKARHDFDVSSSLPTKGGVGVETFEGKPIDVELPSSVSGQHVVNMKLVVGPPGKDDGRGQETRIRAEMTLPVHLRYPDPGCERRGDIGCDEYAWVEVPPALASVRCGSARETGKFYPVLPIAPPVGVALRVPRGMAWHRNVVAWGTVGAAALGCLYTVRTLWLAMSMGIARVSGRNRDPKAHVE